MSVASLMRRATCPSIFGVWQTCNWQQNPALIGLTYETLDQRAMDDDYPYPCMSGMLGGVEASHQVHAAPTLPSDPATPC